MASFSSAKRFARAALPGKARFLTRRDLTKALSRFKLNCIWEPICPRAVLVGSVLLATGQNNLHTQARRLGCDEIQRKPRLPAGPGQPPWTWTGLEWGSRRGRLR